MKAALLALLFPTIAFARDWYVAEGGTGDGSQGAPFGVIQQAVDLAQPGDVVNVTGGFYTQGFVTKRAGLEGAPITIRGAVDGVVIQAPARLLTISHPHHVVEALNFDADFVADDAVRIETAADYTVLRKLTVARAGHDCIDIGSPSNVLIDDVRIHGCLDSTNGRTDAHGIVAGAVHDLTIRSTVISDFSGDAIQLDPARGTPAWDRVTIEQCSFNLTPLGGDANGFPAGTVPGENAIDTKVPPGAQSHLTIRQVSAYGFRGGLIQNMAAFNLKEGVVADIDGVTVADSEIAFRLRAPADVRIANALVYRTSIGIRYEDNIVSPRFYHATIGDQVPNLFVEASSPGTKIDAKNVLVLAADLPPGLSAISGSMAVDRTSFGNVDEAIYALERTSPAVDRAVATDVTDDHDGVSRPQGSDKDVGAYEMCVGDCTPARDGVPGGGGSGGSDDGGCCRTNHSGVPWWLVLVWIARRRRMSSDASS